MEANWKRCAASLQFWWTNWQTTCLNFIFINSLNHRFSYHPTPNALLQITNQLLFQVSTRLFLCTRKTLLNIGRVTRICIFRVSLSPTAISLPKTALLSHSREIQKMSFVPLCCCYCCVVLKQQSNYMHFFTILLPNNRICDMNDWFYCENTSSNILCHQVWSQVL